MKTCALLLLISIIHGFAIIYSQNDPMISCISNSQLRTILPSNRWKGNAIDKKGRFSNYGAPFKMTYSAVWKFLIGPNPQRKIKKNENYHLPSEPDTTFLHNNKDVIVWLGHASFFIRINGINILTDPVFFKSGLAKRKSPLPFDAALLKDIDYVLISHDHRDHLDKKSLQLLYKDKKRPEILAGLKTEEWIHKMLKSPKVQTAGWYQQFDTDTSKIKIFFMPAKHWSKRRLFDTNKHLWGSFVIEAHGKKIFFSGDTGYDSHLKQIGDLFDGIDICIMGIGAFKPEWFMSPNHISPYDAAKASNEMRAGKFIPMHYGTFDFSYEPLGEPAQIITQEKLQNRLKAELIMLPTGKNYYLNL